MQRDGARITEGKEKKQREGKKAMGKKEIVHVMGVIAWAATRMNDIYLFSFLSYFVVQIHRVLHINQLLI